MARQYSYSDSLTHRKKGNEAGWVVLKEEDPNAWHKRNQKARAARKRIKSITGRGGGAKILTWEKERRRYGQAFEQEEREKTKER